MCRTALLLTLLFAGSLVLHSQKLDDATIATQVAAYKLDARGPYRDIRWFCKNGSTLPAQERCPDKGGVQRARYKEPVVALAKSNHIFLGQILATTTNAEFWDSEHAHSRLKQYQLERFLKANDDGWVNRKAQYYRGASQAEDEEAWGIEFYKWLFADSERTCSQYFLIRQSAKDIPHAADNNVTQEVRALSREISDEYRPFMDLRVKIHGQPEFVDLQRVKEFRETHKGKLSSTQDTKMGKLIDLMEVMYQPEDVTDFDALWKKLPAGTNIACALEDLITQYPTAKSSEGKSWILAHTAFLLRKELGNVPKSAGRMAVIDASNKLESMLGRVAVEWQPTQLAELMRKVRCLTYASAGFGYLATWEWDRLLAGLKEPNTTTIGIEQLGSYTEDARRGLEWGTGMVRATYNDVIELYNGFEPLANGFLDDKVRGSVLLALGSAVSQIGDVHAAQAGFSNSVMDIPGQSSIRGLNAGYAMGELVVTDQSPEDVKVSADKIYVFERPPADLKPVAGIATVTEGNMVSHVQLLARNLGIPNAVFAKKDLSALMKYNGKTVFYAVSNKGTVVMKLAEKMSATEKALFTKNERSDDKIRVPVEGMDLSSPTVLNLRNVNAASSGKVCGPKAANLGQLKQMYPDHVVEGLVIPFSIFRKHFDQEMSGQGTSYWNYLKATFGEASTMSKAGKPEAEVEAYVLSRLQVLREAIKTIPLDAAFKDELKSMFTKVLGAEMGKVPVFLRSDTNMEDLKDFTGAGLNLTLFNVLDADKIWQGIRDVWASPYTERSYRWRQHYLLDPENVFPSILIIPSVNADVSGVMITKGVSTGNDEDITVAFNRGVGGAVEGQASETWMLRADGGYQLVSPAREPKYMSIPVTGGTDKLHTTFEDRLLSERDLIALRKMANALKKDLAALGIKGPHDVELGFKGEHIWLFQVRPFVENKRAAASDYLRSITPATDSSKSVPLNTQL